MITSASKSFINSVRAKFNLLNLQEINDYAWFIPSDKDYYNSIQIHFSADLYKVWFQHETYGPDNIDDLYKAIIKVIPTNEKTG